jgi:hypothetical protein
MEFLVGGFIGGAVVLVLGVAGLVAALIWLRTRRRDPDSDTVD